MVCFVNWSKAVSETKKEFLTFVIGKEEFAVEILRVQEIKGWEKPSPLPNVPPYVKGVVDLRGTIVPIIDLRERFNLPATHNHTTVVIVVHVLTKQGERVVGLVVDAVSDVHAFDVSNLQPAPDISNSIENQYVLGLTTIKDGQGQSSSQLAKDKSGKAKAKDRMVVIIDLDKLSQEGLIDDIISNTDNMPTGNG